MSKDKAANNVSLENRPEVLDTTLVLLLQLLLTCCNIPGILVGNIISVIGFGVCLAFFILTLILLLWHLTNE